MKLKNPTMGADLRLSPLAHFSLLADPLVIMLIRKGRRHARRLEWQEAVEYYLQALQFAPRRGAVWVQLGNALGQLGDPAAARVAYQNAAIAEPSLALGHKHLGIVLRGTTAHEEGMQSLTRALLLDPSDADLRKLLEEGESAEAVEARLALAALAIADSSNRSANLGFRANILRKRARHAARRQHWSECEILYRKLLKLKADDARIWVQFGHALNEQGMHGEAELAYRKATAIDPLLTDGWMHLGYVLSTQGRRISAREAFKIVNRLAPSRKLKHPVLMEIDQTSPPQMVEAGHAAAPAEGRSALAVPEGMSRRQREIWMLLAAHCEGGI